MKTCDCEQEFPHEACSTESHWWTKGAQSQNLLKIYPNLSDESKTSQLHLYWKGVLDVTLHSWNRTLEHGVENKVITTAPCFSLAKFEDQNDVDPNRMGSKKNCASRKKQWAVNCTYTSWKCYWCGSESKAAVSRDRQLVLLHDNALAPSAMIVKRFLATSGLMKIS
jgi:hypothetical protein